VGPRRDCAEEMMERRGKTNWIVTAMGLGLFLFLGGNPSAVRSEVRVAQTKAAGKKKGKKRTSKTQSSEDSKKAQGPKKEADKKAESDENLSTGPAKLKLPMVEEKKEAGASLEEKLLDDEIAQLQDIIKTSPEGPSKSDLLFRLAERYYEKSRGIYYSEMQEYDKLIQEWMDKREKDSEAPEPKINNRRSQVYTKQAMDVYRIILEKYPEYQRRDEVLFTMGYNLYESGEKPEGVKMYWELIKSYPESRFVPDAYLAMGEHFFNSNDVFNAKKAYEKAMQFKDLRIQTFALYKLAWCDYNLGEYDKGIEKFKQVVKMAENVQTAEGEGNKIQLKREALQDLVLAFSQVDALEDAENYYMSQVGESGTLEYMRKLAHTYEKQGKSEMVVKSFMHLLNQYPNDPECPSFHNSIVMAYRKMNNRDAVKREVSRLIEQYKPGSQWAEVNKSNKMAVAKAVSLVEESLRDLVTSYHQEAQETKSWDTYNLARTIYAKYLKTFPDSEYAYKLRWYYSDILYKMADFFHAAEQFSLVVQKDPKGVYSQESAYNAVLCWEKCMIQRDTKGIDCTKYKPKTGKGKIDKEEAKTFIPEKFDFGKETKVAKEEMAEKEIPFMEKKFLESADAYAGVAANHDMYIPVRFKSAFIFYKYKHFAEMTKRFGEIIERFPKNEFALKAVKLSLNTLYIKATSAEKEEERTEHWKEINHWAKTFKRNDVLMSNPVAKKDKFGDELQSLIEESAYNVTLSSRAKEALKAASGFDQFVKDYPKSKYAHRALYAAMVIYDEARQLDLAIDAGKSLLKEYPTSDRYNATIGFLAGFYTHVADFDQAATYSELYFSKWLEQKGEGEGKKGAPHKPKKVTPREKERDKSQAKDTEGGELLITDKEAMDSLYNASLLRESIGDFKKAVANYVKYLKYFPDAKDAADVFYKVGLIYESQEQWREADRIYEGYPEKYAEKSAPGRILNVLYRHALALRKINKEKESDKHLDKIIEHYNELPEESRDTEARTAVAHSRFMQVEPEYQHYMNIKLELPPSTLKKNLFTKIDTRPKLEKKFEEIIAYQDPDWSIASLVRIGQLSQNLSDSMLEAPIPAGLTPEQQDIYQEELQKQSLPLEEKAISFYRKAIEVSNTKGIFNEWTLKAQDLLRDKYEPNSYPQPFDAELQSTEYFYVQGVQPEKMGKKQPGASIEQPKEQ
jgi:tetratricopeptide (TPR) repeat protein